jgi:hypothetical protein
MQTYNLFSIDINTYNSIVPKLKVCAFIWEMTVMGVKFYVT